MLADQLGGRTQVYNGLLVNLRARTSSGLTLQGGVNTGAQVADSFGVRASAPESAPLDPFCPNAPGLITRVTGLVTYTVPKLDVLLSTTLRSDQGPCCRPTTTCRPPSWRRRSAVCRLAVWRI